MPNFNTKDMKVSITRNKGKEMADTKRLSGDSIDKLKEAFEYCITSDKDVTMVVAFVGFFIHKDDFALIKTHVESLDATIIASLEDLIVIRTYEDYVVTTKFVGGSMRFFIEMDEAKNGNKKRKRRSSASNDDAFGSLTQECSGIPRFDDLCK